MWLMSVLLSMFENNCKICEQCWREETLRRGTKQALVSALFVFSFVYPVIH